MFRYVIALGLVGSVGWFGPPSRQDDIEAVLARSEELYYEARFKDSIELLLPRDAVLQPLDGRLHEKLRVKLQLALLYIALNDIEKAKFHFAELCTLDADCSLDPQKYPPKVIALFEETRAQHNETKCRSVCETAGKRFDGNSAPAAVEPADSAVSRCGCVTAPIPGTEPAAASPPAAPFDTPPDPAERAYQEGVEAYKQDDFVGAIDKFRAVLKHNSGHELALQYIELTRNRLSLLVEQKLLEWRKNLVAGDMELAAAGYRQLLSLNVEDSAGQAIGRMREEYRKALSPLAESWNRACAIGDKAAMDSVRRRADELLPEPAIGEDILSRMAACGNKACVQMEPQQAMLRVKVSGTPEIPADLQKFLQNPLARMVSVKARIEENGDVIVLQTRGESAAINEAVQMAVEKWKFLPAIIDNEARCVETALPIVITPSRQK